MLDDDGFVSLPECAARMGISSDEVWDLIERHASRAYGYGGWDEPLVRLALTNIAPSPGAGKWGKARAARLSSNHGERVGAHGVVGDMSFMSAPHPPWLLRQPRSCFKGSSFSGPAKLVKGAARNRGHPVACEEDSPRQVRWKRWRKQRPAGWVIAPAPY
jgi:hypothetical protein